MPRREKMLLCAGAVFLVLLFLMSSTDLIIKERAVQIDSISVILSEDTDDYYQNFRKGMEKAATDLRSDVRLITLYDRKDQDQQVELTTREIRDGAGAVVIEPAEEKAAVMALESLNPGCPVIFVSASSPSDFVTDSILIDYFEAGRILGEKAAEKNLPGEKVCLFAQGMAYNGVQDAYEGVCSVLNDQGISYELYVDKEGKAFRKVIENTVYPGTGPVEVVALDVQSLDRTASILNESSVYKDHVSALYGIGSTTGILNLLDQGIIDGLVTYDQFSQGYLSTAFKKQSGESFTSYVSATKIEKAKELIEGHQYMMYEISDLLGFDTPFYFSKVFKKVAGISPKEYEAQCLKQKKL